MQETTANSTSARRTVLERASRVVFSDRARIQLAAQTRKGVEKYGQTLDEYPGDFQNVLQHALEEGADLVQYLTRAQDLAPARVTSQRLVRLTLLAAQVTDEVAELRDRGPK